MRRMLLLLCLLCICGTARVQAQHQGTGFGLILGEPTGLSFKAWIDEATAVDAAAAWSFERNTSLQLHSNYLIHDYSLIRPYPGQWPVYYGLGGRIKFDEESRRGDRERTRTRVGIRVPLGTAFFIPEHHIDLFLEVVPVLDLIPDTRISINGAVGVRYFFD